MVVPSKVSLRFKVSENRTLFRERREFSSLNRMNLLLPRLEEHRLFRNCLSASPNRSIRPAVTRGSRLSLLASLGALPPLVAGFRSCKSVRSKTWQRKATSSTLTERHGVVRRDGDSDGRESAKTRYPQHQYPMNRSAAQNKSKTNNQSQTKHTKPNKVRQLPSTEKVPCHTDPRQLQMMSR